ncbi:hypothetical protein KP509_03G064300 [Ceratopteris richardii]|uniref:Nitrate regulatory gene2 protein-like n=1 Tax=Ceratopteris richardii TaxID=49495 RepID=A0A8T2V0I7_CERRI|nr:hypothetical protein KP509_03G064300 [Ceratopteris richardii]
MGCTTSRLDESDVIRQCKERRKAIKEAVRFRQDFAEAHAEYIQALKSVGLALRRFSEGDVSDTSPKSPNTPLLTFQESSHVLTLNAGSSPQRSHSCCSSSTSSPPPTPPSVLHPIPVEVAPPPPVKIASPILLPTIPSSIPSPPSSRASRFSQSSPPPLTEASSPHRSVVESAPPSRPVSGMGSPNGINDFSRTFYSPYRDDLSGGYYMAFPSSDHAIYSSPPMPSPPRNNSWFSYDIFDAPPIPYNLLEQRRRRQDGGTMYDMDDYDDGFYNAPTTSIVAQQVHKEEVTLGVKKDSTKEDNVIEEPKSVPGAEEATEGKEIPPNPLLEPLKADVSEKPSSTPKEAETETPKENPEVEIEEPIPMVPSPEELRIVEVELNVASPPKRELAVVTNSGRDLAEAVKHIHVYFNRACRSGKDVSSILETQIVYRHFGFEDQKAHWSRKASVAVRDAYEDNDTPQCGMFGSHASTLERLYAWEKKLYDEVKAGEMIRISFDQKCQQLHDLDAKGGDPVAIDKTRASLKKLDTRLIVALRTIHLASMRIQKLTNEELYPQLMELLGGLMSMWNVMWECHKAQAVVAAETQSLENSVAANEASETHIKATCQLEYELERWQVHFQRWISAQKHYIKALHMWMSKCHFEPERDSKGRAISPCRSGKPAIFYLLLNWMDALMKFEKPQEAVDAICNFSVVVHSLEVEQAGELDLKKNVERSAKELDYSTRSLKRLEGSYSEHKGESNGDTEDNTSKRSAIQLRREDVDSRRNLVELNKQRHLEVMFDRKEKTLSRFRDHLPLVFESMATFAKEAAKIYAKLLPEDSPAREIEVDNYHLN